MIENMYNPEYSKSVLTRRKYVFQLSVVAILLPSLVYCIFFLFSYYYKVLSADEWVSLDFYVKNGLKDSVLCAHNGHPLVLPNLIYRLLLIFFNTSPLSRFISVFLLVFGYSLIIAKSFIIVTDEDSCFQKLLVGLVFLSVWFWLVNAKKLLWGMAVHDHLTIFGVSLVMLGLSYYIRFGIASLKVFFLLALGALLSCFSFGFGGALLIAMTIALVCTKSKKRLLLVPILGLFAYVWGIARIPSCYTLEVARSYPHVNIPSYIDAIKFVSALLANPIAITFKKFFSERYYFQLVIGGGFILCVFMVTCFISFSDDQQYKKQIPFVVLGWFSIGSALMICLGREPTAELANAPRYIPVGVCAVAALVGMLLVFLSNQSTSKLVRNSNTVFIVLLFLLLPVSNVVSSVKWMYSNVYHSESMLGLLVAASEEERYYIAKRLQPNKPNTVQNNIDYIKTNKLDIFSKDWEISNFDTVGDCHYILSKQVEFGPFFKISGWARSENGSKIVKLLAMKDDNIIGYGVRTPLYVAEYYDADQMFYSAPIKFLRDILGVKLGSILGFHSSWIMVLRNISGKEFSKIKIIGIDENEQKYFIPIKNGRVL